ncbi:hypothetical protein BC835DRAFT_965161 [Cytidiella melzeri]|nr:hypothetical protein BC835DRAFT_965161 [Cytidiella melzeri]
MQDELAETPAPDGSPQAGHKRKGDGNRKTVHNHKRMRIGDRVNVEPAVPMISQPPLTLSQ